MINQSTLQGYFPEELKLVKVLPIYKSEDEQLVHNYRPISILHFLNYIIEIMEENELFYKKSIWI